MTPIALPGSTGLRRRDSCFPPSWQLGAESKRFREMFDGLALMDLPGKEHLESYLLARLWSGGTRSKSEPHPPGNNNEFHELSPTPNAPGLAWHELNSSNHDKELSLTGKRGITKTSTKKPSSQEAHYGRVQDEFNTLAPIRIMLYFNQKSSGGSPFQQQTIS